MVMVKVEHMKQVKVRITKNQLIGTAIDSVRKRGNLSMFREYVDACNRSGLLDMGPDELDHFLDQHGSLIFGKGQTLHDEDNKLPSSTVEAYGRDYWRDGHVLDGPEIEGIMKKRIDPTPLRVKIPNYMDIIQPRPAEVYLIDDLKFWVLFKVVAVFRRRFSQRPTYQLYLVGRDRHTDQPFALGIPNGFVDKDFEACLRWTMNAHKGDVTIEV